MKTISKLFIALLYLVLGFVLSYGLTSMIFNRYIQIGYQHVGMFPISFVVFLVLMALSIILIVIFRKKRTLFSNKLFYTLFLFGSILNMILSYGTKFYLQAWYIENYCGKYIIYGRKVTLDENDSLYYKWWWCRDFDG